MRKPYVLLLLVALPLASSPSWAACSCFLPEPPDLPDAASAEPHQMNYTSNEIASWQGKVANYKQCLEQCIVEADQDTNEVIDKWNAIVEEFNARNQ